MRYPPEHSDLPGPARRHNDDVVDLRGFPFSVRLAWWFWLASHVFFLVGSCSRVIVLLNGALADRTCQRGARIVWARTVPRRIRPGPDPDVQLQRDGDIATLSLHRPSTP